MKSDASTSKKRKIDRACDNCRKYKRRCDGPKMPDNVCSTCIQGRKNCTYVEASKPRGPPKAYVNGLEDRVEYLESLLRRLRPEIDLESELGPPIVRDSWKTDEISVVQNASHSRTNPDNLLPLNMTIAHALASAAQPYSNDDRDGQEATRPSTRRSLPLDSLFKPERPRRSSRPSTDSSSEYDSSSGSDSDFVAGLDRLTLVSKSDMAEDLSSVRYMGKSSSMGLVGVTMHYKHSHDQSRASTESPKSPPKTQFRRRPEVWEIPSWEFAWEGDLSYTPEFHASLINEFPPPDLTRNLIDIYFNYVNPFHPVLHRPTFLRQFDQKLYEGDHWFAAVCFLVFAVASRWSDDPRILPEGSKAEQIDRTEWRKAGFKWFQLALHIIKWRRNLIRPTCLFEIQTFTFLGLFLRGTTSASVAWILVSAGLRKCQDVGAHLRKSYSNVPTAPDEQWKRAFWCLVVIDRFNSALFGRPCTIEDDQFDVDLPLEVDDEYWPTETKMDPWQQPKDRPSVMMAAFNAMIKMSSIVALTLKTHFNTDKSKQFLDGMLSNWREKMVSQLDEDCQKWVASLPKFLRWSEDIEDPLLSNLSASLFLAYHQLHILLYMPFVPAPSVILSPNDSRMADKTTSSAMLICTNAARSSVQILNSIFPRGCWNAIALVVAASGSASVLIIRIWEFKAKQRARLLSGEDADPIWDHVIKVFRDDVNAVLRMLQWAQPKWEQAAVILSVLPGSLPDDEAPLVPPERPASHPGSIPPARHDNEAKYNSRELPPPHVQPGPHLSPYPPQSAPRGLDALWNSQQRLYTFNEADGQKDQGHHWPLHSEQIGQWNSSVSAAMPSAGPVDDSHLRAPAYTADSLGRPASLTRATSFTGHAPPPTQYPLNGPTHNYLSTPPPPISHRASYPTLKPSEQRYYTPATNPVPWNDQYPQHEAVKPPYPTVPSTAPNNASYSPLPPSSSYVAPTYEYYSQTLPYGQNYYPPT